MYSNHAYGFFRLLRRRLTVGRQASRVRRGQSELTGDHTHTAEVYCGDDDDDDNE